MRDRLPLPLLCVIALIQSATSTAHAQSYALRFRADGESTVVPDSARLDVTGPLTVEAWVKPDPGIRDNWFNFIVSKQMMGTGYTLLTTGTGDHNRYQFETNRIVRGSSSPSIGEWTHVAGTWASGELRIYVNGALENTLSVPNRPSANDFPLWIGSSPFGADTNWRGTIDEVRVWDSARTPDQIAWDMQHYACGDESGLRAYYSFDEGGGQFARDVTGGAPSGWLGSTYSVDSNDPQWVAGMQLEGGLSATPPVKVHALLIGCNQTAWPTPITPIDYNGWKDVAALEFALNSLPNVETVETHIIDSNTTNSSALVKGYIESFESTVAPGETFLVFVGSHSINSGLWLQIDEEFLPYSDLASSLNKLNSGANKVVMLPGCYTGGAWFSLQNMDNTCLFAGAPDDKPAFLIPDPAFQEFPFEPWFDFTTQGMSTLALMMFTALWNTPWTGASADTNDNGLVTLEELSDFVEARDLPPLFDFRQWAEYTGEDWPILYEFGDLAPFSFDAQAYGTADLASAPLAGSGHVIPEPTGFVVWSLLGALGITVGWWRRRRQAA